MQDSVWTTLTLSFGSRNELDPRGGQDPEVDAITDLAVVWLWSEREGVFSHETALALHGLSVAMTARVHLSLPAAWRSRRLRVPPGIVVHHADVEVGDRSHIGCVPVTSPSRTVTDSAEAHVSPDLVLQAIDEGTERGMFTEQMVASAIRCVEQFVSRSERR